MKSLRVLIGCEYSGIVRNAFLNRGYDAWSCDLLPPEDGSNRHIKGDVRSILGDGWDLLVVVHPPCTRLCRSGRRWLSGPGKMTPPKKLPKGRTWDDMKAEFEAGIELFTACWRAPIRCVAVENPEMHDLARERMPEDLPAPHMVHPFWFGHPEYKNTGWYLRNLDPLVETNRLSEPEKDSEEWKAWNRVWRMGAEASSAEARAKAPRPITVTQKDGGGYRVYTGSAIEQAKALLRDEEGFRPSPYWDTNAHRVGYASTVSAMRSLITSAVLGSAMLASVTDLGTSVVARKFAGIGGRGVFSDVAKAVMPATRREAVSAGLLLDSAMHVFHAQARYIGTIDGPGWTSFIADRVLTLSGLTPWTQAGRHAFGLAFMRTAAEQAGKSFDRLPDALRNVMQRYGISAREWDQMRNIPMHDLGQGTMILRPQEIDERIHPKLAEKYLEMIQAETEYAVPNGSNRSKVMLLDENRPGTFVGEILRSFAQFKSFGTVFLVLHGRRIHDMIAGGEVRKGAAYAGSLLISTTLLGGMALQMKQVAQGRDPQDMSDPAFWGAALLQGGGLGIYGDFLFSNVNRYGSGFATTLGGPLVGRASDLWNLTAGNAIQLASGEETHFGREVNKFMRSNIPGSSIWYTRLAWERIVMDQLQFLMDPQANKAFKQRQRFFQREFGQEFWWAPGETTPRRGPDLTTAIGTE